VYLAAQGAVHQVVCCLQCKDEQPQSRSSNEQVRTNWQTAVLYQAAVYLAAEGVLHQVVCCLQDRVMYSTVWEHNNVMLYNSRPAFGCTPTASQYVLRAAGYRRLPGCRIMTSLPAATTQTHGSAKQCIGPWCLTTQCLVPTALTSTAACRTAACP
jgi:hypothetical protein